MKYTLANTQLMNKYKNIYQVAQRENDEKKCLVGSDKKYRITTKDSYFDNISDPDAIYEYCLYPLYLDGNIEIKNQIQEKLLEMANSNDVLEIFQVYNFIMSQDILCRIYTEVSFLIDFSNIIQILTSRMSTYEQEMKDYRKNGFEQYKESLWDNIQRIIRKSSTLKKYTS